MNGNKKISKKMQESRSKNSGYQGAKSFEARGSKNQCDTSHKFNDVSWYSKNQQMLVDAASFSYNQPVGSKVDVSTFYNYGIDVAFLRNAKATSVPGIMTLDIAITPGLSTDSSSPINLAAQNIYSFVRYMNSGSKNYDEPDLMQYLFSMDSVYAAWNWAKRIYGVAALFSQYNWYLPDMLLKAMGVDSTSIITNLANFREGLNRLAAKISSFCVPAVMPLFVRHSWLFSNIYKDSNSNKAQLYVFNPAYFYEYNETSGAGQLDPVTVVQGPSTALTAQQILDLIEGLLNKVMLSEDIGVMSGDILKAYGQSKLFKISPVTADYAIVPTYNEEVLNQIHNATIIGAASTYNFGITQDTDTNALIFNPEIPSTLRFSKVMVNMPWDVVTPANTMVATRLTCCMQRSSSSMSKFAALGTEAVVRASIWYKSYVSSGEPTVNSDAIQTSEILQVPTSTSTWSDSIQGNVVNFFRKFQLLSNFDWHPLIYPEIPSQQVLVNSKPERFPMGIIGDVSNYTIIDVDSLQRMNLTAIMSEFNIPQIGSF